MCFPVGSIGKESAHSVGDPASILGSGRSPGGGNGNPLQYSCLENPMDRGAWWATVLGVGHDWSDLAHVHFVEWKKQNSSFAHVSMILMFYICSQLASFDEYISSLTSFLAQTLHLPWSEVKWSEVMSLSRVRLCDLMNGRLPDSSVHGIFPGKSTGVGCHFLLQGIFLTQGSNPGLLHCRQMLYPLSHQGYLESKCA